LGRLRKHISQSKTSAEWLAVDEEPETEDFLPIQFFPVEGAFVIAVEMVIFLLGDTTLASSNIFSASSLNKE
jgi:hypothetical protein